MAVNYTRTNWHNRAVQRPRTYVETTNSDNSVTHTPAPGTVAQEGTPLNEDNLNNIEQGVVDCAREINSMLQTLAQMAETLSRYNTRIGNNERGITDIQKVDEAQSANIRSVTEAHNALAEDVERDENAANAHYTNYANPHRVSKEQLGLGNVPNVTTNDQRPTFTEASSDQNLASGETLSTLLGKISRGLKRLWAHIARTDNPHSVTKAQVGLGNVPNVTTNNQTPSYSVAVEDQELSSGETMATAFGKLKRAVKRLYDHISDTDNPHNTGFFDAAAVDFLSAWGEPAVVGTYTGNGSSQGTLTVNNTSVRGQQINLGFSPSKVAIFVPYQELTIGHSESSLRTFDALDVACGADMGVVLIGPMLNYYHSGCGSLRTVAPQQVLTRNHGGAVVYGNSFIVQAMSNSDNDTTMKVNSKNTRYLYMAWR